MPDDVNADDINSIISATQTSRRFSYREVGLKYLREMEEHGFVTNEELANYHGISHVSVSKRVQAAKINSTLIALFPDYEAIPNSYYNRLFRLQKNIEKNLFSLEEVVENTREEIRDLDISDIAEAQKTVMEKITTVVEKNLILNHLAKVGIHVNWQLLLIKINMQELAKSSSGRKNPF
uniref:hypothetical protein n=1 Tax=Escherichia coli TaxID=562 RepID=UPI001F2148B4|nr:hypothetical protein [Escherichia coli]UGK56149.1 hypothetical protein [Escherichia coli]